MITGTVEKIIFGGMGLIRSTPTHPTIFVPYVFPLETLEVIPVETKKNHLIAKRSTAIPKADCKHYGICQGCQIMHLSYDDQLIAKNSMINDAFRGLFENIKANIRPSKEIYNYRMKVKFLSHWDEKLQGWSLRYFEKTSISECLLFSPQIHAINTLFLNHLNLDQWSMYASFEVFKNTPTTLLIRITHSLKHNIDFSALKEIAQSLIVNNQCLWGEDKIQIQYPHGIFDYDSLCFMQNNHALVCSLYEDLASYIRKIKPKTILDLYCGIGITSSLFSKTLGDNNVSIIGIEENPHSILKAKNRNEANIQYHVGLIENFPLEKTKNVDCVFINPPRVGMHKKALEKVLALKPNYIIYSSCMISTLCRDLKKIQEAGYKIDMYEFYDFFPHTTHFESLICLKL